MRIFEVFEGNDESRNADQLAEQTGAEKLLLGKICIHYASLDLMKHTKRSGADLTIRQSVS